MSSFTDPLVVTPLPDGRRWKLVEPFRYHVGSYPSDTVLFVPKGFVTDFASVPRLFWNILPPWGKYGKAAVLHDFCYRNVICSRYRCDRLFLEAMKVLKVPFWKRQVMYWAVRCFGFWAYHKER